MSDYPLNRIDFIKTIDDSIYEFFLDLLASWKELRLEYSFHLFYSALIEKTVKKIIESSTTLEMPSSANYVSFSKIITNTSISNYLYSLGLDTRVVMYCNLEAVRQKHGGNYNPHIAINGLNGINNTVSKPGLIKMFLVFCENFYNSKNDVKIPHLKGFEIVDLLTIQNKNKQSNFDDKNEIIADLNQYSIKIPCDKNLLCERREVDGFSFRNDIETVSFKNNSKVFINKNAFQQCTNLKSVDFSNVFAVYMNAFKGCTSLKELDFSKSNIFRIYSYAFADCPLKKILLPPCIKYIDSYAFGYDLPSDCIIVFKGSQEEWNQISIPDSYRTILEKHIKF